MYLDQVLSQFWNLLPLVALILMFIKIRGLYIANKRDKASIEIINNMRLKLDISDIKKVAIESLAKQLGADRVYIAEISSKSKKVDFVEAEYRATADTPSLKGKLLTLESTRLTQWAIANQEYFIPDVGAYIKSNRLSNTLLGNFYKEYQVKSSYAIPLRFSGEILGVLVLHFSKNKKKIHHDNILLLRDVTNSLAVAIYQSKLFLHQKRIAKRETLLRQVIQTIRSTLDIKKALYDVCEEIAKAYNVERVTLNEIVIRNHDYDINVIAEYKQSNSVKGISEMIERGKLSKILNELIVEPNRILTLDNIQESELDDFTKMNYKKLGVKSALGAPIKKHNQNWGFIFLSEYSHYRSWSDDDINLIRAISDQIYLAINQAQLYEDAKERADRENVLRRIVETIRTTLDVSKIENAFVMQTGQVFEKASRIFITNYNPKKKAFMSPSSGAEYLSSPSIKSIRDEGEDFRHLRYWTERLLKFEESVQYDTKKFIKDENLENTPEGNFLKKYNIGSYLVFNISYRAKIFGAYIMHFSEPYAFDENDVDFIRDLALQAGVALYQAQLYENVKETAKKESLLREISSKIKLSDNLNQVYNYLISKIANEFNYARMLFFETPTNEYKEPTLKNEFMLNDSLRHLSQGSIPDFFTELLEQAAESHTHSTTSDTSLLYANQPEKQKFFDEFNIKSIFVMPMTRYNGNVKILGIFVICDSKVREWNEYEVDTVKSIVESSVSIIWEITKIIEINRQRDTFIETLAHDLQVPLVGEEKALEFLLQLPNNTQLKDTSELLHELRNNNKELILSLKKFLSSYYYEAKRKILDIREFSISNLIQETKKSFDPLYANKSITIEMNISKNLYKIKGDRGEIKQVIHCLLENALTYTPQNGVVCITAQNDNDNIIVCVSDTGAGLTPEKEAIIFKRYEMAKSVTRKIGSGLSLYLSKQIVEAHNGKIWYKNEESKGAKFCFSLPKSSTPV